MTIFTVRDAATLWPVAACESFTDALTVLSVEMVLRHAQPAPTADGLIRLSITRDDHPGHVGQLWATLVDTDGVTSRVLEPAVWADDFGG